MRTWIGGRSSFCLLTAALAAAVVAARPGPALPAPGLLFEPCAIDLGAVPAGEPREAVVVWRRVGRGLLPAVRLARSCGCLRTEGLPESLPEDASGELRLRLAGASHPGPFRLVARAMAGGDSPRVLAVLEVRGFIGDGVAAAPAVLELGARSPGSRTARRVDVSLPPGAEGEAVAARLVGLPGEVEVVPPLVSRPRGSDVLLRVAAPETAGPFSGVLVVSAGDLRGVEIPIRGLVVAPP
jgi:hypothetical protein